MTLNNVSEDSIVKTRAKILVVDDEPSIRNIVSTYLENEGYAVASAVNGHLALRKAREWGPDLVVLDLNLPGIDGLSVASQLLNESDVYILMLSARSEEIDRVTGLRTGADDYLTKPFSPREMVARVDAILRRSRDGRSACRPLTFAHVRIDTNRYEVRAGNELLDLTRTEFDVLLELAKNAGRVLTRDQLIERVWGSDFYGNDRVVDVYVGQVRRKIENASGEPLIFTVRGVGYKFVDELV
ncbi:MAG: response regulator transcription factor [Candidatus Promineifilaceae bacterium]|jgi:two-component system alkaline phosphatase synthesis response regulator PhoP